MMQSVTIEKKRKRGRPPGDLVQRRQELKSAALELFLEKGFHSTRIEDIVAKAGLGKGTFYHLFQDKEALFDELLQGFFDEIRATLHWTLDHIEEGASLYQVFSREAQKIAATLMKYEIMAKIVMREGRGVNSLAQEKIEHFYSELVDTSERTLKVAIDLGLLAPQNPRASAICIVGSIEKIYWEWIQGKLEFSQEIVDSVVGFLLRACGLPESEELV